MEQEMNKAEFIDAVCKGYHGRFSSKNQAAEMVDAVLETIQNSLAAGHDVTFTGFGGFKPVQRAERKGRNPRTGASIAVPAKKAVKFTPGKLLREAVK
jgi:DNA-binding protein HU-beta